MRRPSREKKRDHKHSVSSAAPVGVPVDVHVPAAGPGAGTASIGAVPVFAADGEEIQDAVLRHLHRIALATGHPVHATVHDERIGYVVLLRVCTDGASQYAGEPMRMGEPVPMGEPMRMGEPVPMTGEPWGAAASMRERPAAPAAPEAVAERLSKAPVAAVPPEAAQAPRRDKPTHALRAVPESVMPEPTVEPEPVSAHWAAHAPRHESEVRPVPSPAERSASAGAVALASDPAVSPLPEVAPPAVPVVVSEAPHVQVSPGGSGPVDPGPQPRREPSTMRLSAAKPVDMSEAFAPVLPGRPKQEPRTMPLTAAKEGQSESAAGGVEPSTFILRTVPEPKDGPLARSGPTPGLPLTLPGIAVTADHTSPAPEHSRGTAPATGTVSPPTGEFGPVTGPTAGPEPRQPPAWLTPPTWQQDRGAHAEPSQRTSKNPVPGPVSLEPQPWPPAAPPTPRPASLTAVTQEAYHEVTPEPASPQRVDPTTPPTPSEEFTAESYSAPDESYSAPGEPYSAPEWKVVEEDPGPKPAPVREFDAVAEAVLDPAETSGDAASPFAEPMSRINEAVKLGRINEAAEMAEQTVAQATEVLGPQHAEVLRLRELTAYIAYLAGDALRSFHLSLDLAVLRHRLRDQRAAYGNVQSAAAAWRAVRDPLQGLHLGRDLIAVWTELAADVGPAADDLEQLEKARTRMGRLTERARALDTAPYARSPHAHGQ